MSADAKPILVIGGGIAGMTAAVEAAEVGYRVVLVEKEAYLGGRVVRMHPLDGNLLFEPCSAPSPGEIHLCHAACGKASKEHIGSEGSRQVWAQHGALDH